MLRVLHLTDTHVVAVEEAGPDPASFAGAVALVQGRTTTELLRLVLDALSEEGVEPDVLFHTGDAVDDGEPSSYAVLRAELARAGAPRLAMVPGNHDRGDEMAAAFGYEPQVVRTVDLGSWQLVGVDTARFHRAHGVLDPDALAALDDALGRCTGHVLLGLHHPPISTCAAPQCQLVPADDVLAVLDRHPQVRAVLSGHLHDEHEIERRGVRYLLSPSTCIQLRHEHPLDLHNRAATPVGARVLDLHDDGRVDGRIVWATG